MRGTTGRSAQKPRKIGILSRMASGPRDLISNSNHNDGENCDAGKLSGRFDCDLKSSILWKARSRPEIVRLNKKSMHKILDGLN